MKSVTESYWTPRQLAERLGVSMSTVYAWLPGMPHLRVKRRIRIPCSLFERWEEEQCAQQARLGVAETSGARHQVEQPQTFPTSGTGNVPSQDDQAASSYAAKGESL